MQIVFFTLNPEIIEGFLKEGIIKNALNKKIIEVKLINFREFALDKHSQVDDTPYGGGSGMLLKPEPIIRAFESIELLPKRKVILPSPKGKLFNNKIAKTFSECEQLIFICGRYEGFDERIIEIVGGEYLSIGDYIISNGELSSLVIFNSLSRYIPGVLGNENSLKEESFENGLLEYEQYTRPESFRGINVPKILKQGHHKKINEWRIKSSYERTKQNRLDLLN